MSITATELKNNLGKYLLLSAKEDIFITKNGKIVAKLTNPHQDRVEVAKSLFGILPKDADLNEAKEYVYIFTPYLIVCNEMMTALKLAAKRGIDIRIVTPAIPDKKMIFRMTQSSYKELLRAGVKIYQYTPGFIHSKCILTDDNLTSIGSINMDNRSFYHHFECGVLVYDSSIIAEVKYDMVSTMRESEEITLDWCKEHMSRITLVDAFLRLLSPLL